MVPVAPRRPFAANKGPPHGTVQHTQRQPEDETAAAGTELLLRQPARTAFPAARFELREDQAQADCHQSDQGRGRMVSWGRCSNDNRADPASVSPN